LATPYVNAVGYSYVNPTTLGGGRFVASGDKWNDGGGAAVTLTFSFPTGTAYHASNYSSTNEWSIWFWLGSSERAAVQTALSTLSHFVNVTFVETSDTSTNVGELRFAFSNTLTDDEAAHAYYPDTHPSAGDVWFNPDFFNSDGGSVPVGSYDYLTILHEVGHALGLKHSFDAPNAIAASKDNYLYSIMSYTASPWSADGNSYASFYPTTPMYYDLLALQGLYGVRTFNAGNNVYIFKDGFRYWQAIHDTGGNDTIVYQGADNTTIALIPGALSSLSEAIKFQRPDNTFVYSKYTVTIGPSVVIENATGGSGNDSLIGNVAANVLTGGAGKDSINGFAGNDKLRGGDGNDTIAGGAGYDAFLFNTAPGSNNHDKITDYIPYYDNIQLENAVFTKFTATGYLDPKYFRAAAFPLDPNDYLVYHKASGNLFYDSNAMGIGGTQLIATLANKPELTAAEFVIV
jgi:Ca2+-binding RTX toxin-like protein